MIYVRDNGTGIPRDYLEECALRYYTTKLYSYEELQYLSTYGFRGEALNSLCSVSSSVHVTTKTATDEKAIKVRFDATGKLQGADNEEVADILDHGTIVEVRGIFTPFPVRLEVQKNKLKQQERLVRCFIFTQLIIYQYTI